MRIVLLLPACLALSFAAPADAHGGGLDRNGCHHDRKRGGYHCHRATAAAPLRPAPRPRWPHPAQRLDDGSRRNPTLTGNDRSTAFRNCAEAHAAGAGPVSRGAPGYGPHLDRDGDGIGCEPYRGR